MNWKEREDEQKDRSTVLGLLLEEDFLMVAQLFKYTSSIILKSEDWKVKDIWEYGKCLLIKKALLPHPAPKDRAVA